MSRIGYADVADYGGNAELLEAINAGRGWIPNVFRAMLFSPQLTRGWVQLANTVRLESTLDIRMRELVILLVARLNDSAYEWDHHSRVAAQAGITAEEVGWLAAWPAGNWHAVDRAVLTFAAAVATRGDVPQWAIDELVRHKGNRFVVDVAVTASYYVAVAHFTAALDIATESSKTTGSTEGGEK